TSGSISLPGALPASLAVHGFWGRRGGVPLLGLRGLVLHFRSEAQCLRLPGHLHCLFLLQDRVQLGILLWLQPGCGLLVRDGLRDPEQILARVPGALPILGGRGASHGLRLGLELLHPTVAEDLVDVQPPVDVGLQHAVDEVLALARQVLGAREVDAVLLLDAQHLLDVGVVVGHGAAHHDVENHAQAPDVVHLGLVGDALEHLGGRVGRRPAEGLAEHDPPVVVPEAAFGEPEVGQLDVEVFVEEEVLALEVSVDDVQVVAVLDGRGQLLELLPGVVFVQGSPGLDELQQVSLDPELHDDVDLAVGRLEDLVGLDDGAVVQHCQDLDLPGQELL
uniref:Uncharacterized protein n=1 Tax=Monodelphis domestica TaxID=13616 RepID=A0A5F8GE35_MONDO